MCLHKRRARTAKIHFQHFRNSPLWNERFDFNAVEKGAPAAAPLRSMHAGFVRYGSYVTRTLARGSRHRRIHFVEFSFLGWLSLSLSSSVSLFLSSYPSLSISLCVCLSFPLTLRSVNIYVLIARYTARRTPKRENSVTLCVSTVRRTCAYVCTYACTCYVKTVSRKPYVARRPGGRGRGRGRDGEDTLTVRNNATKERIHWNTLGRDRRPKHWDTPEATRCAYPRCPQDGIYRDSSETGGG